MADASGQGFTASIVNSIPNYLSADRSVLGQQDGITGTIQYVKLVWGGSGEANLVTDQGSDPTPLPVSLNNPENWFLIDSILDTVRADAGPTAVNVNIVNSTGLCFGSVTLEVSSAVEISGAQGAAAGAGSNLGVTFAGITIGGPIRIRNYTSGSGITEAIAVTFGSIGGTVNISNLNVGSFNASGGIPISGWCGGEGASLPVYIVGSSISLNGGGGGGFAGSTIGVVFMNKDETLIGTSGGKFYGLPVVNPTGGVPLGVTWTGTAAVTIGNTPSVKLDPNGNAITGSVSISNTPNVKLDTTGNAITGSVYINNSSIPVSWTTAQDVNIESVASGVVIGVKPTTTSTTFGNVLLDKLGSAIGYSGSTFFGYPVQIVGGISGLSASISIDNFTIQGGTLDFIRGGTFDVLKVLGGTMAVSGGTLTGIANAVKVINETGTSNLNVEVKNGTSSPVAVQLTGFNAGIGNATLAEHLKDLAVTTTITGLTITNISPSLLGATGISGGNGLGVTFGKVEVSSFTLAPTSSIYVKGDSTTIGRNATNPVGITFTGSLYNLKGVGISGACAALGDTAAAMSVALYGYAGVCGYSPIGMCGDALKVSLDGVGICFGQGICLAGVELTLPTGGITLSGGTISSLTVLGGTFNVLEISNISGGTINIGNTVGVTGVVGITNTNTTPLYVDIVDTNGDSVVDANGVRVVFAGYTGSDDIPVTWSGLTVGIGGGTVGVAPQRGNTGVGGMSGGGTTFNQVLTDVAGVPVGHGLSGSTPVFYGYPVYGSTAPGAIPLGVSLSGVGTSGGALKVLMEGIGITIEGFTVNIDLQAITDLGVYPLTGNSGIGGMSGGGTTFNVVLTNIAGVPIGHGLSGSTAVFSGFPAYGVAGGTAMGVTGTVGVQPSTGGVTFGVVLTQVNGTSAIGYSGDTFYGFPVHGVTGQPAVYTQEVYSVYGTTGFHSSQPDGPSGGTVSFLRISPVRGLEGEPGITLTGAVYVVGDENSGVGVTLTGPVEFATITNTVSIQTSGGTTLAIGGAVGISPVKGNTGVGGMSGGGTTFNVVLTNIAGVPIGHGFSGSTAVFSGFPVYGVSGATSMGVTFGPVSFGTVGMGVTFDGITFTTTRTIISGSDFADGGGNLGIPVFGVAGTTAVRVTVEGGTVSGIFVTDAPGITIMGISTGIPIIGVSGGALVGVTFVAPPGATLNLPATGITIAAGSIEVTNLNTIAIDTIETARIAPNTGAMPDYDKIIADSTTSPFTNEAIVTIERRGVAFARGLTIGPFLLQTTDANTPNIIGVSGGTYYYWNTTPYPITKDYNGPAWSDSGEMPNPEGNPRVDLKHGLYIQLTKADLISHVLIGYTADNNFEFERRAQVLHREYQVAPVWAHAMDQFRRFPGYTGNNNPIMDNDFYDTSVSPGGNDQTSGNMTIAFNDPVNTLTAWAQPAAQKQFLGVIEKPSRIFIPTWDAGRIYILVKGDYQSHAIGSGFWDQESGQWSQTSLYEREFYAGQIHGFTGEGEPNLTYDGAGACGDTDYGTPVGTSIVAAGGGGGGQPSIIQQIINGYGNNPFLRIWGY